MMAKIIELTERGVLAISGPERVAFLQGLMTSDVEALADERAQYAALLTPQGKILFDFFLVYDGEAILIDCERAAIRALLGRLTMYKLRTDVRIEDKSDGLGVQVILDDDHGKRGGLSYKDSRHQGLGTRHIVKSEHAAAEADTSPYDARRIALGIAEGQAELGDGKTLALEANLDQLNGVSFTKGCYVGQELAARMKHRARIRRRILPVRILGGGSVAAGDEVRTPKRAIGEVRAVLDEHGLAYLRVDDALANPVSTASGVKLEVTIPDWLELPD